MSTWLSAYWFSVFLVVSTLLTGLICLLDKFCFAKKRANAGLSAQSAGGSGQIDYAHLDKSGAGQASHKRSWLVNTSYEFFPVFALILILRSFLFEPFQIPSGSMMPTLLTGDFIMVQKFAYGLREPISNHVIIETGAPKRGDVAVFRFPPEPKINYIKRIVGLPGDRVVYQDKKLWVEPKCTSGVQCPALERVPKTYDGPSGYNMSGRALEHYTETLGEKSHALLQAPLGANETDRSSGSWTVPEGHYFVMGDNRDNSLDSRFWGFVPNENLVGKATAIWVSFEFDRASGPFSWIPSNVRFNRIGGIE